jgi:hypothetical protein
VTNIHYPDVLQEEVIVREFAQANNRILTGDCAAFHTVETENALELGNEVVERKLH